MYAFHNRLKELREKKGLSQEQLSLELGIPRSSVAHYESEDNDRMPRNHRLRKIAAFFEVSVDYLLGIDDTSYVDASQDEFKEILSKFENIDCIIRDYYLKNFKKTFRSIEHFKQTEINHLNINTIEDIYESLSLDFKILYLNAMFEDSKKMGISFEEYLKNNGISYKNKNGVKGKVSNKSSQVEAMLKRTHEFIQTIGKSDKNTGNDTYIRNEDFFVQIPIYGEIKAGYDRVADQNIVGYKVALKNEVADGEYFYLIVKGDSMIEEGIKDGYCVLVKKQNFIENGKIGVVIINGDEATLKRVYYEENNVILQASNKTIPPRVLPLSEVLLQGQVKSVVFDV